MTVEESTPSLSLQGKVALVTGGGTGIGKGIALEFARAGADVAISGRRIGPLEDVAEEITDFGQRALPISADISNKTDVDNLVDTVNRDLGQIDILVNNAATGGQGPGLLGSDEDRWDEVIDINLKGVYLCCHAVAPGMIERGSGNIINISSIASFYNSRGARLYGIAKAGVNFMTTGLAQDLAPHNIRVNCIAPGTIQTDMLAIDVGDKPENWEAVGKFVPLGRVGQPVDIATVALFLASGAANYVTSQIISVDAGLTDSPGLGKIF